MNFDIITQDWESGICNGLKPLTTGRKWSKEDTLLAFGSVETDVQARNPTMLYSDVLAAVYDELARRLKGEPSAPSTAGTAATRVEAAGSEASSSATVAGTSAAAAEQTDNAASTLFSDEARAFSTSIADSPVFPDTVSGLAKLSSLGYKLVVLSNSDRPTFEHTRAKLEQGFKFDAILLAEDIGSYKYVLRACFVFCLSRLIMLGLIHATLSMQSNILVISHHLLLQMRYLWLRKAYATIMCLHTLLVSSAYG